MVETTQKIVVTMTMAMTMTITMMKVTMTTKIKRINTEKLLQNWHRKLLLRIIQKILD